MCVLAVARPESSVVCVAGINEKGEWIRPQRIFEQDIVVDNKVKFALYGITKIYVDDWKGKTVRREDRFLIKEAGKMPELIGYLKHSEIKSFLESYSDASVKEVFNAGRTLGLIKPQKIIAITGSTTKIRITFQDSTGQHYSWPVRDLLFYKKFSACKEKYPENFIEKILISMNENNTYFAIGLTQIYEDNVHNEYGGWPMIVGIHCLEGE